MRISQFFSFSEVIQADILQEHTLIKNKIATTFDEVPPKFLKISSECPNDILELLVNEYFSTEKFPSNLRLADVTPIHKKKEPQAKENYRTVKVISILLKSLERLMQNNF